MAKKAAKKTTQKPAKASAKKAIKKTAKKTAKPRSGPTANSPNEPTITVASASLVGRGAGTPPEVNRAAELERVMNEAYNEGIKKGITDPEELVKRKLDARRSFIAKNG